MKYTILICICLTCYVNLFCQSRTLIGYDLATGETDTLTDVSIPGLSADKSDYYIGDFNPSVGLLPVDLDTNNLFYDSQWTFKKPVNASFNINDFPFRTSLRMFSIEDDALVLNCSGSMVSPKHVLTAAHCVSYNNLDFHVDSVFVCPAYDNSNFSEVFECSLVKKIHLFDEWSFIGEDFAILELEDEIGYQTGWISIGFDDELNYRDSLLHKFSYPNWGNAPYDDVVFNGDTLYHSFGYADFFDDFNIGMTGTVMVPGESGSSLIQIIDNEAYPSYGVGTWVDDSKHTRMQKQYYYPIIEVITRDLTNATEIEQFDVDWAMYPNPASHQITFSSSSDYGKILSIKVHDLTGKLLITTVKSQDEFVDISFLPPGVYVVRVGTENQEKIFKLIKTDG